VGTAVLDSHRSDLDPVFDDRHSMVIGRARERFMTIGRAQIGAGLLNPCSGEAVGA
jgi:hypothetical protein